MGLLGTERFLSVKRKSARSTRMRGSLWGSEKSMSSAEAGGSASVQGVSGRARLARLEAGSRRFSIVCDGEPPEVFEKLFPALCGQ